MSLDLPSAAEKAEREPERFLAELPPRVLIDEVQYAPRLFRHLKLAVDGAREQPGRFVLTGSQKLNLMREITDSLAGRCAWLELWPLSLAELRPRVDPDRRLDATMARGLYPELWRVPDLSASDFFAGYVAAYLERDVRQLLNVTSLRDFERFVRILAARSGQVLNKSDVARDVGVSGTAITQWLSVLQASNLIVLLEPYFQNIGKRMIKSPKVYFTDPGLLCFLLGLDEASLPSSPYLGAVWEATLLGELQKHINARGVSGKLWFYRDERNREVDFVLERSGRLSFIEAKWTETPDAATAKTITLLDAELRASALRVRAGEHFVVCRTQHSHPLGEHVRALPFQGLTEVFGAA